MIRHTVAFRLVHPAGSTEEADFLAAARELATIPGVERFEQLSQTSAKNDFSFGFSMEFADAAAYDAYNQHPTTRARPGPLDARGGRLPRARLRAARLRRQVCCGNPRLRPPCDGSSQRWVIAFSRVKKSTPCGP